MIIRYRLSSHSCARMLIKGTGDLKIDNSKGVNSTNDTSITDRLRTLLQTGSAICLRLFAFVMLMRVGQYKIAQFRQFVT